MAVMRELPKRGIESIKRERLRVDSGSLIYLDRSTHSVPTRLTTAFTAFQIRYRGRT
jgi:hypothetical protein